MSLVSRSWLSLSKHGPPYLIMAFVNQPCLFLLYNVYPYLTSSCVGETRRTKSFSIATYLPLILLSQSYLTPCLLLLSDLDLLPRGLQAHHQGMYGAKYQWIILGTYDLDWWQEPDSSIDCTPEQLNQTLHGYLATDVLTLSTSDEMTESGKVSVRNTACY